MTDLERAVALLVHAPATMAIDGPNLRLRDDLGFALIALAELAIAIEDAFGIAIEVADLDGCRTVRDLQELVTARSA